jgi:hypothetical protein
VRLRDAEEGESRATSVRRLRVETKASSRGLFASHPVINDLAFRLPLLGPPSGPIFSPFTGRSFRPTLSAHDSSLSQCGRLLMPLPTIPH